MPNVGARKIGEEERGKKREERGVQYKYISKNFEVSG